MCNRNCECSVSYLFQGQISECSTCVLLHHYTYSLLLHISGYVRLPFITLNIKILQINNNWKTNSVNM